VRILDRMAWAACGLPGAAARPSSLPMHARLAAAWGVDARAADLIRRALVLTADHELNASTYTTRVVASTRAPLGACVLAGLTALVGPLHGGMTDELRALLADPAVRADPAGARCPECLVRRGTDRAGPLSGRCRARRPRGGVPRRLVHPVLRLQPALRRTAALR